MVIQGKGVQHFERRNYVAGRERVSIGVCTKKGAELFSG